MARGNAIETDALKLISKCSVGEAEKFLHGVVNSLCGQRGLPFDQFSKVFSLSAFWQCSDAWAAFFKSRRAPRLSEEELLSELQYIPESYRTVVATVWKSRATDIVEVLLKDTEQISGPVLKDFDWKVKLVLGSDKVASQKVPLLSLDLTLFEQRKGRDVSIEMTSEEVHRLIVALEAAHKAAVQLQA
ncbi:COMM domain-containing protein 8-like [Ornithodoros turicata]|uniref:COMM domain-containing protein 8-like n=1 Tax=Ornithodoros turicata TaxID=34597 RepID=UPI00313901B7